MPAIFNVGNVIQANDKKVSSKLTFEAGESFKGRIISKGEGNEVVVKLTDGWQFTAEVEGDISVTEQGLIRFKVEDFEDGKLKLKIIPNGQLKESSEGNIVGNFIEKTGLTKEDLDILKSMVKFGFPLTKENIALIKSILSFNEKINTNPEEVAKFIDNFLAGKGIDEKSTKGQQIKDVLNDFFKSFKTVNKEDILFLLENDIDINKENIDSYNKLFKSDGTIKEYFDNVSKSLQELNVDVPDTKIEVKKNIDALISKSFQNAEGKISQENKELASKIYDSNNTAKGKISMLSILKSMVGSDVELTKETLKGVLIENIDKFTTGDFNDKFSKLNSLSEKELNDMVIKSLGNKKDVNNESVKAFISNILGKEIDVPENELQKIREIITLQMDDEVLKVKEGNIKEYFDNISKSIQDPEGKIGYKNKEIASKIYDSNNTAKGKLSMLSILKSMVGSDVELTKETLKGILIENSDKFTTGDFNDKFSKLNSLSEEELSDMVKTSLGNKKDINNESVKSFISNILGKEIDIPEDELQKIREIITLQMDDEVDSAKKGTVTTSTKGAQFEGAGKPILSEVNVKTTDTEIKNSLAKEVLNLSSKDIIVEDIKVKIENMKDVIKNIIAHAELKGESMDKVMQFIKGNISDFKLLNSVNNEYYYLDIPVKNNGEEYPCKLIIKDSRKDNKKIDTTNVKLIVAVKTINLGTVDGFLRVSGSNLNVNIKCDEEFVKMINKSKDKLLEGLQTLGFFTSITVTPKVEEVSLTGCRDFFEEKHDRAIDIKV